MEITRNGKQIELTAAEPEQAYREKKRDYLKQDADYHIETYTDFKDLSKNEYKHLCLLKNDIISEFEKISDCNKDENSTWDNAISNVISRKGVI